MGMVLASLKAIARGEEGVSIVEYALALSLIAIASIAAIALLGAKLSSFFNDATTTI